MATETTVQLSDTGHLPCGNVPFHKGVCRDAYLKRATCDHCEHLVNPDDAAAEPAKSASKAAWVDFAVAQGADRDAAEAKTRDDLVDEFGTAD